jgi:hypothetical protein
MEPYLVDIILKDSFHKVRGELKHPKEGVPVSDKLKEVGNICTDLWWYSIMDYDKFISLGGNPENVANIIEVPAGEYEMDHFYGVKGVDDCREPYAIMRKID